MGVPRPPSGLVRRLRRERVDELAAEDVEEFVQLLLLALELPEVQTRIRAVVGRAVPPSNAPLARGGARGGRGR
jgi:hypothetical protein